MEKRDIYVSLALLMTVNYFYALPVAFNTAAFSVLIIYSGAYSSADEMLKRYKAVHIDKSEDASEIETLSSQDAYMFPVQAGITLCSLYALIKYFGKEIVNPLILAYMGFGGTLVLK